MPYYIGMMLIAGIVGEIILSKVKDRFKGLSLSFMVAMLSHYIGGTIIPYIFIREQQLAMIKDAYGLEYATKMKELQTVPLIIGITIAVMVVSIVGSHISKKFCKKHF